MSSWKSRFKKKISIPPDFSVITFTNCSIQLFLFLLPKPATWNPNTWAPQEEFYGSINWLLRRLKNLEVWKCLLKILISIRHFHTSRFFNQNNNQLLKSKGKHRNALGMPRMPWSMPWECPGGCPGGCPGDALGIPKHEPQKTAIRFCGALFCTFLRDRSGSTA